MKKKIKMNKKISQKINKIKKMNYKPIKKMKIILKKKLNLMMYLYKIKNFNKTNLTKLKKK